MDIPVSFRVVFVMTTACAISGEEARALKRNIGTQGVFMLLMCKVECSFSEGCLSIAPTQLCLRPQPFYMCKVGFSTSLLLQGEHKLINQKGSLEWGNLFAPISAHCLVIPACDLSLQGLCVQEVPPSVNYDWFAMLLGTVYIILCPQWPFWDHSAEHLALCIYVEEGQY